MGLIIKQVYNIYDNFLFDSIKEELEMIDITPIMEAIITLVFLCITTFLIPYIKSKTTSAQQEQIQAWVNIAVMAAEQLIQGSGMGAEKKEYVITPQGREAFAKEVERLEEMLRNSALMEEDAQ